MAEAWNEDSGSPGAEPSYRRRQFIVDKELQYHYLSAWLVSAFLMICVFGFFVILFKVVPAEQVIHREGLRNLYLALICNAFILILFALMMGLHGVMHTHRIAGAAYHLKRGLTKLLRRDYTYTITLRKRDYLKELAGSLNDLTVGLRADQERLRALAEDLGKLKAADGLPEPAKVKLDEIRRGLEDVTKIQVGAEEAGVRADAGPSGYSSGS
ncbi:MAG: hypothetical protein HY722_07600 [Planctomycetes bacterium]|nr:hypothetical protein [Planctomycetota bacterium]